MCSSIHQLQENLWYSGLQHSCTKTTKCGFEHKLTDLVQKLSYRLVTNGSSQWVELKKSKVDHRGTPRLYPWPTTIHHLHKWPTCMLPWHKYTTICRWYSHLLLTPSHRPHAPDATKCTQHPTKLVNYKQADYQCRQKTVWHIYLGTMINSHLNRQVQVNKFMQTTSTSVKLFLPESDHC